MVAGAGAIPFEHREFGWCVALRSPSRNTWASCQIRGRPATNSFFIANSGEVCR